MPDLDCGTHAARRSRSQAEHWVLWSVTSSQVVYFQHPLPPKKLRRGKPARRLAARSHRLFNPASAGGQADLKQAEAVRSSLTSKTKGETAHGPTVAECAEKYIASRRHELGEKTVGQHRLLLDRLTRFCEGCHAQYMRNLTVDLLETFKTEI